MLEQLDEDGAEDSVIEPQLTRLGTTPDDAAEEEEEDGRRDDDDESSSQSDY